VVGLWIAIAQDRACSPLDASGEPLADRMITATNAMVGCSVDPADHPGEQDDAVSLLSSGAAIWTTNIIIFALWYWEFDSGRPAEPGLGQGGASGLLVPADAES